MNDNDCTYISPRYGSCERGPEAGDHDPERHGGCPIGDPLCSYHEYQPPVEVVGTIDLTPSDEGFAAIADTFIQSILRDVPVRRNAAVKEQLAQTLKIAYMFGTKRAAPLMSDVLSRLV